MGQISQFVLHQPGLGTDTVTIRKLFTRSSQPSRHRHPGCWICIHFTLY